MSDLSQYSDWELRAELEKRKKQQEEETENYYIRRERELLARGESLAGNDQCADSWCRIRCTGCDD